MDFSYKSDQNESHSIYKLSGKLIDRNQAGELVEEINRATEQEGNNIVLDLSNLGYLNSSGLNIFINLQTKIKQSGNNFVICGVNEKIMDLLVMTKLNGVFKITDTLDNALNFVSA